MSSPFLPDWPFEHAERRPDAPAVDSPQHRLTYGALAARTRELAAHLSDRGVTPGDRVLVALPPSPAAVIVGLAVQRVGATVVEIDRTIGSVGYAAVLRHARPRFAIVAARDGAQWAAAADGHAFAWSWALGPGRTEPCAPTGGITPLEQDGTLPPSARGLPDPGPPRVNEDAAALVLFTSGSTGKPHAVVQTFRNIAANTRSIVEYLALSASDRAMLILPFHYCYGRSVLQTHLYVGGSVFVDPRFMYPRVVVDAMVTERCTGFAGVPLTFEILRREVDVEAISRLRLRYLTQAGGPMRPETTRWVRQTFAPAQLYVMYGQTEATARLTYLPPADGDRKLGSIGVPIPGVDMCVVDEEGHEVAAGEVGHLVARGDNITAGYLDAPEETAAILHDGWLWTGDLARRDEDGFLFLVGRAKEILKIAGHRVSPVEMEVVLAEYPGVAEVAVIGAPDAVQGEVAVAFVVSRPGAKIDEGDVRRFCRERLPAIKVPAHVVAIEAIPRNGSGKPLKASLARAARAAHSGGMDA